MFRHVHRSVLECAEWFAAALSSLILDPGPQLRSAATTHDWASLPTNTNTTTHHHSLHTHRPVPPIGLSFSRAKGHVKFTKQGMSPLILTANEPYLSLGEPWRHQIFRQIFTSPQVLLPRLVWLLHTHDLNWSGKQHSHNPFAFLTVVTGLFYYITAAQYLSRIPSLALQRCYCFLIVCVIVFALSARVTNQERIPGTNTNSLRRAATRESVTFEIRKLEGDLILTWHSYLLMH